MKLPIIAFCFLAAAIPTPMFAGDFYVLGAAGHSAYKLDREAFDNVLRNAGAAGVSSTTENNDSAYKVQLGYQFNRYFAVELGYVDLGKAKYKAGFLGGSAQASIKARGTNLAALGILPLDETFSVFAKLGAINARADTKLETSGLSASVSSTNLRMDDGVGLMYELRPGVLTRLEYEQFHKLGNTQGGTERVGLWSLGLMLKF